jgi:hypothetical protein
MKIWKVETKLMFHLARYHNHLLEFTLKNRPRSQPIKHKGPRNCLALHTLCVAYELQ